MQSSSVRLLCGDALEHVRTFADGSFDAIVTDPPYELGLCKLRWDNTGIAFNVAFWRECQRVLKPGAHLLAFGSPRTYHRMACAIEDAGLQIRDSIHWVYGNGMPKSIDLSKAIDRRRLDRSDVLRVTQFVREARHRSGKSNADIDARLGTRGMASHWTSRSQPAVPDERQWAVLKSLLMFGDELDSLVQQLNARKGQLGDGWKRRAITGTYTEGAPIDEWNRRNGRSCAPPRPRDRRDIPSTESARRWHGWGTALKPAHEPIVVARKRPIGTTTENLLEHGTGGLNIGACRIPQTGRLPSNVVLDRDAAEELDSQTRAASRFFYIARASPKERRAGLPHDAMRHPTMKPIALMRHLVRLVTPPGACVLDPFTGSGTTGIAAVMEGMDFVGIEREPEYVEVAQKRIEHWKGKRNERNAA